MALGRNRKLIGVFVGLALVLLLAWIGNRWWVFKQKAKLREGIVALKKGEFQVALAKLKPYADGGNRHAQSIMGEMYARGLGVPYDEVQASMWFRRSECCQDISGMEEYGLFHRYLELDPDPVKAVIWLKRAAEAGHPEAQNLLADEQELDKKGLTVDSAISEYWRKYASPES